MLPTLVEGYTIVVEKQNQQFLKHKKSFEIY